MGKYLIIDLTLKENDIMRTPESAIGLRSLDGSTEWAKRADSVHIFTKNLTKKLSNYLIAYSLMDKPIKLYFKDFIYEDEKAIGACKDACNYRALDYALANERKRTWELIRDYNIPMEIVANIDDHLNHELLNEYDITIGESLILYEKMNTYKPTDLQREEWGVSDEHFVFSKPHSKLSYRTESTLADKLTAYIALQYYICNDITSDEYNQSRTSNINAMHQFHVAEICGHAPRIRQMCACDEDPTQDFIDHERAYRMMY